VGEGMMEREEKQHLQNVQGGAQGDSRLLSSGVPTTQGGPGQW
jgi:hypothetical protein